MKYHVYILYSRSIDRYYVGQTYDLQKRLEKHSLKTTQFTKRADDWVLVYQEVYDTRKEAINREREIKGQRSRRYIAQLVESRKAGFTPSRL